MSDENSKRRVNGDKLRELGSSQSDIADAKRMEDLGLFKREPSPRVPEIGTIERTGDHKGEIYGGIFPDGKPGWILEEPEPMTHYDAVELKGRALPTREQGRYIHSIKDKGALKDIFARHSGGSSFDGHYWLDEHNDTYARQQQFSSVIQDYDYDIPTSYYHRDGHLTVLSVRR